MRLYNTLIGAKEEFVTLAPAEVKMYVCGPTTYNYIHLGNARPLVVFDTIRRYLEFKGYKVRYIQNFTDIDDKIINRAAEESVDPLSLSEKYIREYFIDADALGIKRAQVHPRVSEHIDEIIAAVAKLIECNSAYELEGNVYYRVKSFANYGFLSHRSLEDMLAGARVEVDERKEDPMDFALWKKTKPGELFWESPWGPGRPGWHIECSVMATNYLGNTIDIHGGGRDLIFPHHENEIAQAEALTGEKFVKYWLHNGFITVNDEKMSKSLGNFFILRDILKKYSPDVVRFYLINTHYRSPLDFDDGKLEEAKKSLQRIKTTCRLAEEFTENAGDLNLPVNSAHSLSERLVTWQELLLKDGRILEKLLPVPYLAGLTHLKQEFNLKEHEAFVKKIDDLQAKFIEAMDDDFNTAKAIGVLFEIIRELNVFVANENRAHISSKLTAAAVLSLLRDLGGIIGILGNARQLKTDDKPEKLLTGLAELRNRARVEKNYQLSDAIRDLLHKNGVVIEDTAGGSRLKYENTFDLDLLVTDLLKLRDNMKQANNYQWADSVRQALLAGGIIIEDTKQGSRWKMID